MKTTLFERWREKRRLENADTEELYLNPADARIGDLFRIDLLDERELEYELATFRVVTREIAGKRYPLVDYRLCAFREDDSEETRLLRYIPLATPDPAAKRTHAVYLLRAIDSFEYDETVAAVLALDQGYAYPVEGGQKVYPGRVDGIRTPYSCSVEIIQDTDHDGEAERDEVETGRLTLWDFWRQEGAATEFLFVEVDGDSGWTELYEGTEIDSAVVSVHRKGE